MEAQQSGRNPKSGQLVKEVVKPINGTSKRSDAVESLFVATEVFSAPCEVEIVNLCLLLSFLRRS